MKTAVGLGVDLTIDHAPGHSNILADGLPRDFPATLAQFDPALRVSFSVGQLLTSERPWSFWPKEAPWPDTLLKHWENHPMKDRKGCGDRPSSQRGVWASTRPTSPWKLDVSGILVRFGRHQPVRYHISVSPDSVTFRAFEVYCFCSSVLSRVPAILSLVALQVARWG